MPEQERVGSVVDVGLSGVADWVSDPGRSGDWLTCSPRAFALNPEPVVGYDIPLPNGCWKCIGCGKILSPRLCWNQCGDCDTRYPEEM